MEHMANIQNNIRARDKHDVTSKSGDKHSQTNHSEDKHIFSDANIEAKLDTAKL
jgi:hypothetical protein